MEGMDVCKYKVWVLVNCAFWGGGGGSGWGGGVIFLNCVCYKGK